MRKKTLVSLILVFFTALAIAFSCAGCSVNSRLELLETEVDIVPNYVLYNTIYTKTTPLDLDKICDEQGLSAIIGEVFGVWGDTAYFVVSNFTENGQWKWHLVSVNLETEKLILLCQVEGASVPYQRMADADPAAKHGYCTNEKIVLNNADAVLEYDVMTGDINEYSCLEYVFPERDKYGMKKEYQSLLLSLGDQSYIFRLEEMAADSKGISAIWELRNYRIWDGSTSISKFFEAGCVQIIDGRIYAIGQCLNFWGEAYAILLQYDQIANSWEYVGSLFVGDSVSGRVYCVH